MEIMHFGALNNINSVYANDKYVTVAVYYANGVWILEWGRRGGGDFGGSSME